MQTIRLISFVVILSLTSCFSMKADRQVASLDHVELRQHFFFFGLLGDNEINLVEQCPRGVSAFQERFSFEDIIFTVFSIGIYSPRTVYVNCAS